MENNPPEKDRPPGSGRKIIASSSTITVPRGPRKGGPEPEVVDLTICEIELAQYQAKRIADRRSSVRSDSDYGADGNLAAIYDRFLRAELSEAACYKYFDFYRVPNFRRGGGIDGRYFEIRSTWLPDGRLLTFPTDKSKLYLPFVLVRLHKLRRHDGTLQAGPVIIPGWAYGHETQANPKWRDQKPRPNGGYGDAFYYPNELLQPLFDLLRQIYMDGRPRPFDRPDLFGEGRS